ncbi:MAG: copper chaperone PCu(A)C [Pseudomonadota bacterium]|nr:copper chaperone PCu(A)C [Pseudomonadota bacterium]
MKLLNQTFFAIALTLGAFFAGAPAADAHEIKMGKLVIHHPWIKQPIGSATVAGAYTKIDNTGTEDDTLLKVTVEGVPTVQIHDMKMEGETMKMAEMKDGLVIPAGKSVELKPKSLHIMMMGLKSAYMVGEEVKGTFTFAKAGAVDVDFEVVAPDGEAHVH